MIKFIDITQSNRDECIALSVSQEQKGFVAANSDSLAEAQENPGMIPVGISRDDKLIGFAMYSNSSDKNKSWIIRFMIDKEHQRKGFGKEAISKLIQLLFDKYSQSDIRLCVEPENVVAIKFYESFGFVYTGEKWGNELIYELKRSDKMSKDDCVLCNLLSRHMNGEEDIKVVYESEHSIALYATKPFAEVHIMIVSKKHIPSLFDLTENDSELVQDIWKAVKVASEEVYALKSGCKLEMYTGKFPTFEAVKHFHCHVIYDSSVD